MAGVRTRAGASSHEGRYAEAGAPAGPGWEQGDTRARPTGTAGGSVRRPGTECRAAASVTTSRMPPRLLLLLLLAVALCCAVSQESWGQAWPGAVAARHDRVSAAH